MYPQNNQQNQPLRYRTDGPMWQMTNINYNALPYVPPNIQTVPWLMQYVPLVAGMLMSKIQTDAQQGPVSMFLYNFMAENGWQNQQFTNLVQDTCDYIFIENQQWTPSPHQVEGIVAGGVNSWLSMRALGLLLEFPALYGVIDPRDRQAVDQIVQQYHAYMERIANMRRGTPQNVGFGQPVGHQMYGQQQQQQMRPQGHQPYTLSGQSVYAGAGPGYGAPTQNRPLDSSGGRDFGGSKVMQQVHGAPQQQAQQYQPASQQPPFVPRKETPMMDQSASPAGFTPSNLIEIDQATWRGGKQFPYPPAFNPITHKLLFQVGTDGITIPIVQEGNLNVIDYDRHNVASLFGKPPAGMPVQQNALPVERELQKGIKALAEEAEASESAGANTHTVLTNEKMYGTTSLSDAWATAQISMMGSTDPMPSVYRSYARIYTPIIGWEDESEHILNLRMSYTYAELHAKLGGMAAEVSPALITAVNARMTDHMNNVLHKKLSIAPSELTVTDFLADLPDLLTLVKANYGDEIEKALLKGERKEIRMLFEVLDKTEAGDAELLEALCGNLLAEVAEQWKDKDKRPQATYMAATLSLTLIDVLSHDLQVQGLEGVGNSLLRKYQPALFDLALNIFESAEDSGNEVYRHLIRTKDGRILEVSKGNIGSDFMLLSLVK